jgi:ABC-type bacteriocin/lantibiotic exporter with double-glycine peptidase domain
MLKVPCERQLDDASCLPTCIYAVLSYKGEPISYEEIAQACSLDPLGAVFEIAIDGVQQAEFDVRVVDSLDFDELRAELDQGNPMIALVSMGPKKAHAVVVCEVTETEVVVMDPQIGDYTRFLLTGPELSLASEFEAGFYVSGSKSSTEGVAP